MSIYPPPSDPTNSIFNTTNWETNVATGGISLDVPFLDANYTKFPTATSSGSQYLQNTNTLVNMTINDPQSIIGDTFNAQSVATTTNLYTTTEGSGFKIRLSGTQSVGYTTDIGGTANTNQVANLSIVGSALNPIDVNTDLNIAEQQDGGTLNIGTNENRTNPINIGTGSTSSKTINIGHTTDTLTLNGLFFRVNAVNLYPNASTVIDAITTLGYNTSSDEGLLVNSSATTAQYYINTPTTLKDFSFWIYNNNDAYYFNFQSGTFQFVFNQNSDFNYLIPPQTVVWFYFSVATGTINVIYDSTTLYQPKRLGYSSTTLPTFTLSPLQNGYLISNTTASVSRSGGTAGGGATSVSGAIPIGVYYVEVLGHINCSASGTLFRLQGWNLFASTVSGDSTTTINNIAINQVFYTQTLANNAGNKFYQSVSGYWVNTTAGAVIYGTYALFPTGNTGTAFTFESTLKITKIG